MIDGIGITKITIGKIMKSLKEQIAEMHKQLLTMREDVYNFEKKLRKLEDSRVDCQHEWDNGVRGYEHEGVYCTNCGINDMYLRTLLNSKKQNA